MSAFLRGGKRRKGCEVLYTWRYLAELKHRLRGQTGTYAVSVLRSCRRLANSYVTSLSIKVHSHCMYHSVQISFGRAFCIVWPNTAQRQYLILWLNVTLDVVICYLKWQQLQEGLPVNICFVMLAATYN